jgi:hypothetical protein
MEMIDSMAEAIQNFNGGKFIMAIIIKNNT